jgi:hypothetical protein
VLPAISAKSWRRPEIRDPDEQLARHKGDDPAALQKPQDALADPQGELLDVFLAGRWRRVEHQPLAVAVGPWRATGDHGSCSNTSLLRCVGHYLEPTRLGLQENRNVLARRPELGAHLVGPGI